MRITMCVCVCMHVWACMCVRITMCVCVCVHVLACACAGMRVHAYECAREDGLSMSPT